MSVKLKYLIYKDENMLFFKLEGTASVSEVINVIEKMWADADYNVGLNYVADVTGCDIKIKTRDILLFISIFKKKFPIITGRGAVLVENPTFTAAVTVLSKKMTTYDGNICYITLEALAEDMGISEEQFLHFEENPACAVVYS